MTSWLRNMSLTGKVTLVNTWGILVAAVAIAAVSVFLIQSEMLRQAGLRAETNMRVAWEVLHNRGKDIRAADGVLFAGDYRINDGVEVVDRVKALVGGTATVFMGDQRVSTNVIGADGKRAIGTRLARGEVYDAVLVNGRSFRGEADILGSRYSTAYDPIKSASGQVIGVLYVGLKQSELLDSVAGIRNLIILVAFVVSLISVITGFVFMRLRMRPLGAITGVVGKLRANDLAVEIPAQDRSDEIGTLARAIQAFKEGMIEAERVAATQRREEETRAERARRIEALCQSFDATSTKAVTSVAEAASQMRSSSEAMGATAEETTRQASAVTAASEQASANVQTVASAAEELAGSISEIGRQVTQASQIAAAAVTEAEKTNVKVQGLAQAANKIGEVVALITDIAEQTNLLALNATIEAARAGDAGKGFAVVASEVKNLANQTAKATDEIGAQIAGIQSATREAVAAIEEITRTISQINEVNSGVASAVEEQGVATQEIARNVEQAAVGTQEVSANIGGVSKAANETGAVAGQIHKAAGDLSQQSEKLRAEVDHFLTGVRAA
ncbi:methyl-accepting chemotaxis protein [Shumkonia mesophila]|uniref:methyl-accepting chemotaxis protein n=1 Tax=Shumkonia mesophila TaxID=2838854 RepID=UPI002934FC3E|nr:cache domain-containing protein [Shumkonia mesophila]